MRLFVLAVLVMWAILSFVMVSAATIVIAAMAVVGVDVNYDQAMSGVFLVMFFSTFFIDMAVGR